MRYLSTLLLLATVMTGYSAGLPYVLTTQLPSVTVLSNGTLITSTGLVSTVGSSTAGFQEAVNSLLTSDTSIAPSGGTITFGPGTYWPTNTILISNNFSANIVIEGPGLTAGGIVFNGTVPQNLFTVISSRSRASADVYTTCSLTLRNMFLGSTTNALTNLVYIRNAGNVEIDHCWLGAWYSMTNSTGVGSGFNPDHGGNTVTHANLVGIDVGVQQSGNVSVHDCTFEGLACDLFIQCDHFRGRNNRHYFSGVTNQWANTSPFCLGAAEVVFPRVANSDIYFEDDYFLQCRVGRFLDNRLANNNVTYCLRSLRDTFERCQTNIALTTRARFLQMDFGGPGVSAGSRPPPSTLAGTNPYAIYSNLNPRRVSTIAHYQNTWTNNDQQILSGGLFVTNAQGSIASAQITESGSAVYDIIFTNPVVVSGATILTNGGSKKCFVWDEVGTFNQAAIFELWTNSPSSGGTELAGWSVAGGDGLGIDFYATAADQLFWLADTVSFPALTPGLELNFTNLTTSVSASGSMTASNIVALSSFSGNGSGVTNLGTVGIVKLTAGTNKVSTASFATNRLPVLTYISDDGTSQALILKPSEYSNGSFFTIRSASTTDTNRVSWFLPP